MLKNKQKTQYVCLHKYIKFIMLFYYFKAQIQTHFRSQMHPNFRCPLIEVSKNPTSSLGIFFYIAVSCKLMITSDLIWKILNFRLTCFLTIEQMIKNKLAVERVKMIKGIHKHVFVKILCKYTVWENFLIANLFLRKYVKGTTSLWINMNNLWICLNFFFFEINHLFLNEQIVLQIFSADVIFLINPIWMTWNFIYALLETSRNLSAHLHVD